MADYLNPQDLANAKVDAKTLGEAVNDKKIVKPRYGDSYKSIPMLSADGEISITELKKAIEVALAAGAGAAGWDASLVHYDGSNQADFNKKVIVNVESIADMLAIKNPKDGDILHAKGYYAPTNFSLAQPYCGGGVFDFVKSRANENDAVTVFDGWVRRIENSTLSVHDGGAVGDYNATTKMGTDDSAAIQRVFNASKTLQVDQYDEFAFKSINVEFDGFRSYYVAKHILHPANVNIIGNGATLFGNAKSNDCFRSAKWYKGDLVDVTDKTSSWGYPYITRTRIEKLMLKEFNIALHLRWTVHGFTVSDVVGHDCKQFIQNAYCYYFSVIRTHARSCDLGYKFYNLNGMLNFQNVVASACDLGYEFGGGCQATQIESVSAEACKDGIYIWGDGDVGGVSISSCYFEHITGTAVISAAGNTDAITISKSFFNNVVTIAKQRGNGKFIIEDDNIIKGESFRVLVDTSESNGYYDVNRTQRNPVQHNGGGAAPNSPLGISNDNSKYKREAHHFICNTHKQVVFEKSTVSGNTQAIHMHEFGLIPQHYYGRQQNIEGNLIPFCSQAVGTYVDYGVTYNALQITTSIYADKFSTGLFNVEILHGVSQYDKVTRLCGRWYGSGLAVIDLCLTDSTPNPNAKVYITKDNGVFVIQVNGLLGVSGKAVASGVIKLV